MTFIFVFLVSSSSDISGSFLNRLDRSDSEFASLMSVTVFLYHLSLSLFFFFLCHCYFGWCNGLRIYVGNVATRHVFWDCRFPVVSRHVTKCRDMSRMSWHIRPSCREKSATFTCHGDMSPTCRRHSQHSKFSNKNKLISISERLGNNQEIRL